MNSRENNPENLSYYDSGPDTLPDELAGILPAELEEYKPEFKENFDSSSKHKAKMPKQLSLEDERKKNLQEVAKRLINGDGGVERLDAGLAEVIVASKGIPDQDKIVKHELDIIEQEWEGRPEMKNKGVLDLYGVLELDDDAAEILSRYEGTVQLNSLKTLSDAAALAFSEQPGFLYLEHLENFSTKAAALLAKRKFKVFGSAVLNRAIEEAQNPEKNF